MKAVYTTKHSIASENIKKWFDTIKYKEVVYFSTQTQLTKLRLEHLLGSIYVEEISFDNCVINIMDDGYFNYFPEGMFDEDFDMIMEIEGIIKAKEKTTVYKRVG